MTDSLDNRRKSRFFETLAFKLSLAIFMISSILLSSLGIYYIKKFSVEIDHRLFVAAQIPGNIIMEGIVPRTVVRDRAMLSRLMGENVLLAFIDQPDKIIMYSSDPDLEGTRSDLFYQYINAGEVVQTSTGATATRSHEQGHEYLYVTTQLMDSKGLTGYLHAKISTDNTRWRKHRVALGFLLGFTLTIALVTAMCAYLVHEMIAPRLRVILRCIAAVERGHLAMRVPKTDSVDEIGGLGRGVNKMIAELQHRRTDQRRLREELEEARDVAEKSNRIKSEFLANMSHEIRTPMNGVLGMAQLMKDTDLTEEQREYMETISTSAENLLKIINNILDLSRIEMGRFTLCYDTVDLRKMLHELHVFFIPLARTKGVELKVHSPDQLPNVRIDECVLRQILINLIGNALKFTHEGRVEVDIRCQDRTANKCRLVFRVADTGIGIPKETQKIIFNEFTQADGSHTREYGGTGLGLAISSKMVKEMGGHLRVSSELGKGSEFSFSLTVNVASVTHESHRSEQSIENGASFVCRVLLAEDNKLNQRVATKMLEKMGCHVDVVENGHEAVTRLMLTHPSDERPHYDVVLMDIQMPVLDGLKASERIRELEGEGYHVPIIAITAHAMKGDREDFLKHGMDGYISKPVKREDLYAVLKQMCANR